MAIKQDDYMNYDKVLHRYELTSKYCLDVLAIDIEYRIKSAGAPNGVTLVNKLLKSASSEIYSYLYQFNNARDIQWIIANSDTARDLIMEAMGAQLTYILTNGDLAYIADKKDNESVICHAAKFLLNNTTIPETGSSLNYCGSYRFVSPSYVVGGY